jgi:hypothetical protein
VSEIVAVLGRRGEDEGSRMREFKTLRTNEE